MRQKSPPNRLKPTGHETIEAALSGLAHDFSTNFVREPDLLVGRGIRAPDPKLGLSLHGFWTSDETPARAHIRLAAIGSGATISAVQSWLSACRYEVRAGRDLDPYLYPAFPGLETLGVRADLPSSMSIVLSAAELARLTVVDRDTCVEAAATVVREKLSALAERDQAPDVVIVALPDEVRAAAGGGRRPPRRRAAAPSRQLSFLDFSGMNPAHVVSRTLHRALKAEAMRAKLPIQMAWMSTFEGGETVEDDATRAWNLWTGLYYKAGGIPWRVRGLQPGTCYVGISFFRSIHNANELQTSMAQAFTDTGEGTVLRGQTFQWERSMGAPHLTSDALRALVTDVLDRYERHHTQAPKRLVIHKSSEFDNEEVGGVVKALEGRVHFHDLLGVRRSDIRFLRAGNEPPIRGTVVQLTPTRFVAYTRGYVPFLRMYPGLRIPHPLELVHASGQSAVRELVSEIFALTRMNWNSAHFASAEPITLGFSRNVGLILSELPADIEPETHFKYYM
jgi:hypothetical protein